jgi:hypothetical protein
MLMAKPSQLLASAALALPMLSHGGSSTPWPEVPPVPRGHSEWVARDVQINGQPSRIERFESEVPPAEVLAHYRSFWANAQAGPPRETTASGWQMISTLHGPFQIVVQVRPHNARGSEGYVSVANVLEMNKDYVPRDMPRVADGRVVQVTESVDGPKRSVLVTLVSPQSLDMNMRRYRDEWNRLGWSVAQEHSDTTPEGGRSYYGSFNKPQQEVEMTLLQRPDGNTYVTVNMLKPAAMESAR